jgi:hypothetical protein
MDLPGASYFYTLAQIGITFSGFAALLMGLRQMRGAAMSKFQLWVTRAYVQSGLVTAMNAMLSPLLFGLGLSVEQTWRGTSTYVALQSLVLLAMVPRQWREATTLPLEMRVKIHIALGVAINLLLLLNAAGWPYPPSGGIVMFAVSWNLFAFFAQFARSIDFFFSEADEER